MLSHDEWMDSVILKDHGDGVIPQESMMHPIMLVIEPSIGEKGRLTEMLSLLIFLASMIPSKTARLTA